MLQLTLFLFNFPLVLFMYLVYCYVIHLILLPIVQFYLFFILINLIFELLILLL